MHIIPHELLVPLSVYALRPFCAPKTFKYTKGQIETKQNAFVGKTTPAEFSQRAWGAASRTRSPCYPVYKHGIEYDAALQTAAKQYLADFDEQYKSGNVSEAGHVVNIMSLRDMLTCRFHKILHEDKFRFGCAQKLLNLYLKYQWCKRILKTPPPHCTFDVHIADLSKKALGDIVEQLAPKEMVDDDKTWKWYKSDNVNHYLLWVAGAKIAAEKDKHRSLVEWELVNWKSGSKS